MSREPIAITGIGCRFPSANNPAEFWQLLCDGIDAITEVPKSRWDAKAFYDSTSATPGKINTHWGGFLKQVDQFDPQFFGIAPREVASMDPQQRISLEVVWEALEDAGQIPDRLAGTRTGVFIGVSSFDYYELLIGKPLHLDPYTPTGNVNAIIANRISYVFDFQGPSMAIDTACSSSLVAVHLACQSLWSGESTLALAGGVHIMLSPSVTVSFAKAGFMAPDGRCKTFDARANGYVRSEGLGVVVLKPLSQALADADPIYAVIRGSAVNQDGRSNGLTAPNPWAQEAVLREAYRLAEVSPGLVQYVEVHGTGTKLGDPIEMKSLGAVLTNDRPSGHYCTVGSVKTNIGHLEAAAGIAGLIKVALSLKHRQIPPSLHFREPNPYIHFDKLPLKVQQTLGPWPEGVALALAAVSSFGFGGTNAHVVLEEAPIQTSATNQVERPLHILTLSAKSENALKELAQSYEKFLANHPTESLADICFTANTGRSQFDYRLAVVADSTVELREQLSAFADGRESVGLISGKVTSRKRPKIAFLFTGQGCQYVGMGRQLYENQPTFRKTLDRCDEILRPYLEKPLLSVLYPEPGMSSPLNETAYTQPALFALEYALAKLWKSWGIEPAVAIGHSVGEYVAACVAGVFSLEDGLKLIAERGRLMQALPPGGEMVVVFADEARVAAAIQPYAPDVVIAALNGPECMVISGNSEAVRCVAESLRQEGIETKKVNVSHAFHSPLMKPMLPTFERIALEVSYSSPQIGLISNVTGGIIKDEIATPNYWLSHVRKPVRFATSMETLHQEQFQVFVEIGPKPTLLGMGRRCLPEGVGIWLPSMRQGHSDWQQLLQSLGELYVRGGSIDWSSFDRDYSRGHLQLPTYPFQRQRYWVELMENGHQKVAFLSQENAQTPIVNLLLNGNTQQLAQHLETRGKLSDDELKLLPKLLELLFKENQQQLIAASIKNWFYEVKWHPKPRQLTTTTEKNKLYKSGSWLIFADLGGVGQTLAKLLYERGHNPILVYAGNTYQTQETQAWSINPSRPADFDRLFQEALTTSDHPLQGVVYLWSLQAGLANELSLSSLEQAQVLGVGSVLHLLQALVKHNHSASPRLWLVTRGAVPVGSSLPGLAQASLWGMGKVVALEHSKFWGGMLDLASEVTEDEATKLLAEIENSQGEDYLAFRDGNRYVARVVQKQLPASQKLTLRSDATYLITGGLGALGLKVAQWMVEQGARQLVLIGRSGASSQTQETISQLKHVGAKIQVAQADVCNEEDLIRIFEGIEVSMPPLRGIVHAAGVLDDGILLQQNWERFTRVMAPKVQGTWNLHLLTKKQHLDFFLVFSSTASLLGSPGQGNYAAANAFMDTLAHYRRSLGLPGLSINWGPWGDSGMAANLSARNHDRLTAQGVSTIAPEQGMQVLEQLVGQNLAQVGVLPFEWSVFTQHLNSNRPLSLFSELICEATPQEEEETKQPSAQKNELLQRLKDLPTDKRKELMVDYLLERMTQVLALPISHRPDPNQSLIEQGLDSLMGIELNNRLMTDLGVNLPVMTFIDRSSIAHLAGLVLEQLALASIILSDDPFSDLSDDVEEITL
ncbi:MAG TPA: type I polyketide synthase [Candidatus Sericytochromatia bacterium]|jgi:acyl transferase domain-containing protein